MKFERLSIRDLILITPKVFRDKRGYFYENFCTNKFESFSGEKIKFIQENTSFSKKGVLRGMHFQIPPKAQDKLIRVTKGKIFDVALDLRKRSKTFGRYASVILSEKNKKLLWIPKGFAHGYMSLSENTEISYLLTQKYSPKHEKGVHWNDPFFNIKWPKIGNIITSLKDSEFDIIKGK